MLSVFERILAQRNIDAFNGSQGRILYFEAYLQRIFANVDYAMQSIQTLC